MCPNPKKADLTLNSTLTQPQSQLNFNLNSTSALILIQPSVGPLLNETKCHLVSFSLLTNQTK